MDILWAPWRMKYLRKKHSGKCVFCESGKPKTRDYVFLRSAHSVALLNIYPYNNGHIMVCPLRHVRRLSQLNELEALDLFRVLNMAQALLDKVLKPDGYNIGMNISKAAGAGIAGHLHIHVVPRWIGDTNFMPALNGTKIISQSLDELCRQLKNAKPKTNQGTGR